MMTNEGFNSSWINKPFRFLPFRLSKIEVICSGHIICGRPFEPRSGRSIFTFVSVAVSSTEQSGPDTILQHQVRRKQIWIVLVQSHPVPTDTKSQIIQCMLNLSVKDVE